MSTSVTVNGFSYNIPQAGDVDWASQITAYLAALGAQGAGFFQFSVSTMTAANLFAVPGYAPAQAAEVFLVAPRGGVLRNLFVYSVTAPTVASCVATVRVNAADTLLSASVLATTNSAFNILNSVALFAGNRVSVRINATGCAVTPANVGISFSLHAS